MDRSFLCPKTTLYGVFSHVVTERANGDSTRETGEGQGVIHGFRSKSTPYCVWNAVGKRMESGWIAVGMGLSEAWWSIRSIRPISSETAAWQVIGPGHRTCRRLRWKLRRYGTRWVPIRDPAPSS